MRNIKRYFNKKRLKKLRTKKLIINEYLKSTFTNDVIIIEVKKFPKHTDITKINYRDVSFNIWFIDHKEFLIVLYTN